MCAQNHAAAAQCASKKFGEKKNETKIYFFLNYSHPSGRKHTHAHSLLLLMILKIYKIIFIKTKNYFFLLLIILLFYNLKYNNHAAAAVG